jgi:hypothetical protein
MINDNLINFSNYRIYQPLKTKFNLDYYNTRKLLMKIVEEKYNLKINAVSERFHSKNNTLDEYNDATGMDDFTGQMSADRFMVVGT